MSESKALIPMGERGVQLRTFEDAYRFADNYAKSGMAPRGLDTAAKILVALQFGAEAGMLPAAAIRSIVVVNGQPSWKGDAAIALVKASGTVVVWEEDYEGLPADGVALDKWPNEAAHVFQFQRVGMAKLRVFRFSVADARTARLWMRKGKDGQDTPWMTYPKRMLRYRNIGFALRDTCSDILCQLGIKEEAEDMPETAPRNGVTVEAITQSTPPSEPDPLMAEIVGPVKAEGPAEPPDAAEQWQREAIEREKAEADEERGLFDAP